MPPAMLRRQLQPGIYLRPQRLLLLAVRIIQPPAAYALKVPRIRRQAVHAIRAREEAGGRQAAAAHAAAPPSPAVARGRDRLACVGGLGGEEVGGQDGDGELDVEERYAEEEDGEGEGGG